MQAKAKFKFIRISPLKLRRIVNLVRGKKYLDSMHLLANLPHKGARIVGKAIKSAAANAGSSVDKNNLIVVSALVDGAGMLKRFRAQSKGRGAPIKKRMSHLTILVEGK